jgi:N-acetyl-1-D-myo-inositol-2-amino-2-deoxy-alpha-D-glucopyranoside deacetylase
MVFPELKRPDTEPGPDGGTAEATILLLHAHPDDETLATGGLMARLAAEGVRVVLVTGTRGERGEVVPGPLKHLEGTPDLAPARVGELAAAMTELHVTDHRLLGAADARAEGLAPRSYSDSGMQWGASGSAEPAADAPVDALSLAPLGEVVADVLAVVTDARPHVIVSYDEHGGYGHPDHIRMHDAAVAVSKATGIALYTVVAGQVDSADSAGSAADDITVPLGAYRDAKFRALGAYRTQLTVDDRDIVLSGGQRHTVADVEVFRPFEPAAKAALTSDSAL